jgi:hypothetical protein
MTVSQSHPVTSWTAADQPGSGRRRGAEIGVRRPVPFHRGPQLLRGEPGQPADLGVLPMSRARPPASVAAR